MRSQVPFRTNDLRGLAERFDRRLPSSRWCGFGMIGEGPPSVLVLFSCGRGERCFLASRFDDGLYDLRTPDRTLIGRARSLDELMARFDQPIAR